MKCDLQRLSMRLKKPYNFFLERQETLQHTLTYSSWTLDIQTTQSENRPNQTCKYKWESTCICQPCCNGGGGTGNVDQCSNTSTRIIARNRVCEACSSVVPQHLPRHEPRFLCFPLVQSYPFLAPWPHRTKAYTAATPGETQPSTSSSSFKCAVAERLLGSSLSCFSERVLSEVRSKMLNLTGLLVFAHNAHKTRIFIPYFERDILSQNVTWIVVKTIQMEYIWLPDTLWIRPIQNMANNAASCDGVRPFPSLPFVVPGDLLDKWSSSMMHCCPNRLWKWKLCCLRYTCLLETHACSVWHTVCACPTHTHAHTLYGSIGSGMQHGLQPVFDFIAAKSGTSPFMERDRLYTKLCLHVLQLTPLAINRRKLTLLSTIAFSMGCRPHFISWNKVAHLSIKRFSTPQDILKNGEGSTRANWWQLNSHIPETDAFGTPRLATVITILPPNAQVTFWPYEMETRHFGDQFSLAAWCSILSSFSFS